MRLKLSILALLTVFGAAACAELENGTYPITGLPCAAEDPVHDFGATDCTPVTGAGVGGM